jgi:hypothetical protein
MRLYNINGKLSNKNVSKYLINWDKKSKSFPQFKTKQFLKPYWFGHIVYEEFPVYGSLLKVDFLNATKKIAIEVNGPQHDSFNPFFHNNSRMDYLKSIKRDYTKSQWLEKNEFLLLQINTDEINKLSVSFFKNTFNVDIV